MVIDDESKDILTITTHKGLFTYNRMPFGISSAPAVFQRTLETLLQGIPGIAVYLDDILCTGVSQEEHDQRLEAVLKRLSQAGLQLKKAKCSVGASEIMYLGHKINALGLSTTMSKVKAITEAPAPKNVTELQSYIGMVTYYDKFLPNLSTVLEPLHKLLRKGDGKKFEWSDQQEEAFQASKELLIKAPVLAHYDPNKPLRLTVDSSSYGVGAVLSHDNHPIAYKSRKLTKAEQNYAQLDKEALAIAFGIKKFHKYVFGRKFTIVTDHKPLLGLLGERKCIPAMTSPRLQRFALTLSGYDYNLIHQPGKSIANADGLSRLPLDEVVIPEKDVPGETVFSLNVLDSTPITSEQVKRWTNNDPVLSRVKKWLLEGWPMNCDEKFQPFFRRRQELSLECGVILWGSRVVIPEKGKQRLLEELHYGHPGITKMKTLARSYMWWPKCDDDIENTVNQCHDCQQQRSAPASAKLHPWEFPNRPWSRIHIDYAGPFQGHMFLVVVDAYSKWMQVCKVDKSTSSVTIHKLREMFAVHGLPEIVVSDNGSCFTSEEFQDYMRKNGIKLLHSAPYHPASNGLAENAVKSFKTGIKKFTSGSIDEKLQRFLFYQHNTPHISTSVAPSELLMGRKLRSRLDLIMPSVKETVEKKQFAQQWYHDKRARHRELVVGDPVWVRNYGKDKKWIEGVISEVTGPVSFNVELKTGQIVHRHVDQLMFRAREMNESESLNIPGVDQAVPPIHQSSAPEIDVPTSSSMVEQGEKEQGSVELAASEMPESESPPLVKEDCVVSPPLRRSSRKTKGIPPERFGYE